MGPCPHRCSSSSNATCGRPPTPRNPRRQKQGATTRMRFELTRAEPIGLAVQRLNHSATSSHDLAGLEQPLSERSVDRAVQLSQVTSPRWQVEAISFGPLSIPHFFPCRPKTLNLSTALLTQWAKTGNIKLAAFPSEKCVIETMSNRYRFDTKFIESISFQYLFDRPFLTGFMGELRS